ncbi:MAG: PQQ-binding-like beta-propeller repeat protein [Planctomycetota bacterium]
MARPHLRPVILLTLALLPWAAARVPLREARSADDLSVLRTDPGGWATQLLGRAARLVEAGDLDGAVTVLGACLENTPDAVVSLRGLDALLPVGEDGALAWPARRIVAVAASRLGALRAALVEPREAAAALRLSRAEQGDRAAAGEVALRDPMTRAGDVALLVAAETAIEAGDLAGALASLRTWLDVHGPLVAPTRRHAVLLRAADVLTRLDDAGGLRHLRVQLGSSALDVDALPVLLDAVVSREAQRPAPPPVAVARGPLDPGALAVLWSVEVADPAWVQVPRTAEGTEVRSAALVDGDVVYVHAARTVRALDARSGLERWRYPARDVPLSRIHAPAVRHAPADRPVHAVVDAGDLLLVVLGEPPATGSYEVQGAIWGEDNVVEHPRTHLVALDKTSGDVRWRSGPLSETDPVLGDPDVGCQGPPLVVGERVYACFGKLQAGAVLYAACLRRTDGALLWRAPLAPGVSGRAPDRANWGRFRQAHRNVLPWGAPPALAGDELCFVTHAGFVAALDPATGRHHWVRALPPYERGGAADGVAARRGFGMGNAPWVHGDTWIVAAHDSPRLVALERGSGRLRWATDVASEETLWLADAVRHLVGVVPAHDGTPVLRLVGEGRVGIDPRDGALVPSELDIGGWTSHQGLDLLARPFTDARGIATWRDGGWQSMGWDLGEDPEAATHVLRTAEGPGAPRSGHLLPLPEGRWLVVGQERVAVVAPAGQLGRAQARELPPAEALRVAVAVGDVDQALALARPFLAPGSTEAEHDLVESSLPGLLAALGSAASARTLGLLVEALPPGRRGFWRVETAPLLAAHGAAPEALAALEAELVAPTLPIADVTRRLLLLEASLERDQVDARERRAEAALAAATDVASLRVMARRFPGTQAATRATARRAKLALDAGDAVGAAAALADLRLDPGPESAVAGEGLPGCPVRRALLEADLWLDAHQVREARDLLDVLVGEDPPLATARGRDRAAILRRALREHAHWPGRGVADADEPVLRVLDAEHAAHADSVRGVRWLGLEGPGAALWGDAVPYVRGLEVGIAVPGQPPRPLLGGDDLGWFGGTLRELARGPSEGGVLIGHVVARQPADMSGVTSGDILAAWEGEPLEGVDHFMGAVGRTQPGEVVEAEIRRRGRVVLQAFQAGSRPTDQGVLLPYRVLYVRADGSAVLPCRSGLDRLEPSPARRTPLWRDATGRGIVSHVVVRGALAYVAITYRLRMDRVVAVDLDARREVWSAEVPGRIRHLHPTASALTVGFDGPDGVLVLDAFDGALRQEIAVTPPWVDDMRSTWTDRFAWDASLGNLFALEREGERGPVHLIWYDTTTGQRRDRSPVLEQHRPLRDAGVSVGAFAAVADGPHGIVVVIPPLLASGRVTRLRLDATHIYSDQTHHGVLDADSRLVVRGRHLCVLRMPERGTRPLAVMVLQHEPMLSRHLAGQPGIQPAGDAFALEHAPKFLSGPRDDRYLIDVVATHEGVALLAANLLEGSRMEAGWVAFAPPPEAGDTMDANRSLSLLDAATIDGRRHAPVAGATSWFVPVDAGARRIPLERPKDARPTPR